MFCITGVMRSTSTAALEVILDLTPFHIMVRRPAWEYISGWIGPDLKGKHTEQGRHYPLVAHISPISQLDEIIRKFSLYIQIDRWERTKSFWVTS